MSNVSTRITKLERTIRAKARNEFAVAVNVDFEDAIARAASNDTIRDKLEAARKELIRDGAKAAEDAALEKFLAERAPEPAPSPPISLDALYKPEAVKIAANGERLPDTSKDAVAILLPQFGLLYTVETWKASNWKIACERGASVDLFDGAGQWQLWDDVETSLTIDRSVSGPAVIPAFRDCTPTDDWYWTRRPLASSPSGGAVCVSLRGGSVRWLSQGYTGRVRAVRRVAASQFGVLAHAVSSK